MKEPSVEYKKPNHKNPLPTLVHKRTRSFISIIISLHLFSYDNWQIKLKPPLTQAKLNEVTIQGYLHFYWPGRNLKFLSSVSLKTREDRKFSDYTDSKCNLNNEYLQACCMYSNAPVSYFETEGISYQC